MLGQRNCLQTADFSAQAGQNAVARAEKFISGSVFLCLSWAYTVMWAEKIQNIRHIIEYFSPSRAVCCRLGREIFYRQQISQSKPGDMLVRGQRNFLQTADFSV